MNLLEQVRERHAQYPTSFRVLVEFVNGRNNQWHFTYDAMEKMQLLLRTARVVSVATPIINRVEFVFTGHVARCLLDDEASTPEDCIVVEADGIEDRS